MLFIEDDSGILFIEDEKNDLCSLKAMRKVHEVNHHKKKEQLMAAYQNAGWTSTEQANIINHVVNDCKICLNFKRSVERLRVSLQKATSFNEIVTLDLKEFLSKYVHWMIDSFSRFMQGKLLNNKKADTIIQAIIE